MNRIALLFLLFPFMSSGQKSINQSEMRSKLDSILVESELLYRYEKSALSVITFAESEKKMRKHYSEVITYIEGDSVKAIIMSNDRKKCLSELCFFNNYFEPKVHNLKSRDLFEKELRLLAMRRLIYNDIKKKGIEIKEIKGYDLHQILVPTEKGYKLYFITATKDKNMIPFGNDYLFICDKNGIVTSHYKFHSRLLATPISKTRQGMKLVGSGHSHLESVPFITATEICTFRIYCETSGHKDFTVISTAHDKAFKYHLETNRIDIEDLPEHK